MPAPTPGSIPVEIQEVEGGFELRSSTLRLRITDGRVASCRLVVPGLEAVATPFAPIPGRVRGAILPGDDGADELVLRSKSRLVRYQIRLSLDPERPVIRIVHRLAGIHESVASDLEWPGFAVDPTGDRMGSFHYLWLFGTNDRTNCFRPVPGFGNGPKWMSDGTVAEWSDGVLRIAVDDPAPSARVRLTLGEETVEAGVDLYPERPVALPCPTEPSAVTVAGSILRPVVRSMSIWPKSPPWRPWEPDDVVQDATQDVRYRPAALEELARRESDDARAAELIEKALLYCGDHPLLWAERAILARRLGEEHPASENLHYLWPLEPVLRTEAFLAGEPGGERGSPLLAPLFDEEALEAAEIYFRFGLDDDFYRVADDLLREREIPTLRYLVADRHLSRGYDLEAAEAVRRAEAAETDGPLPEDHESLKKVAARFPQAQRLARIAAGPTYS